MGDEFWEKVRVALEDAKRPLDRIDYGAQFDEGAAEPCPVCERRFDNLAGQIIGKGIAKVPGHTVGSNWDWVPCPRCSGTGRVEREEGDRP